MLTMLVSAIVAAMSFFALARWRSALFLLILVAAVQDPVRKLMPGTPGWMTVISVPIFFAGVISSVEKTPYWWGKFTKFFPSIATRLLLLCLLLLPASIISLTYGPGSWKFTVLGLFSYSLIFLAVIFGFHFGRNPEHVARLMKFYVSVHGVMLVGGVLQYLGYFEGSRILGDDALGHEWVRYIYGYEIELISGLYRSSDVMGWHASTVCMLSIILAISKTGRTRWIWLIIAGWAILALFLCGRRKMVYMIPVFLLALIWIYFQAGRAAKIIPLIGFLLIPAASVYLVNDFLGEDSGQIVYYTTAQEGDSAFDRLQAQGFGQMVTTFRQTGILGMGLGFATPGGHHLRGAKPKAWQESGSSRVLAELGVPGFLGFVAVLVAIVSALWRITRGQLKARTPAGVLAGGLLAYFIANLGSLTVSGQILADSFIVIFLGVMVGVVLGFRRTEFQLSRSVEQGH